MTNYDFKTMSDDDLVKSSDELESDLLKLQDKANELLQEVLNRFVSRHKKKASN